MYKYLIAAVICAGVAAMIAYAPSYLARNERPTQSEAVVLFVGGETDTPKRYMETVKLMEERYARLILIPAYGVVMNKGSVNGPAPAPVTGSRTAAIKERTGAFARYPGYFENTHVEVLEAKRIMDEAGFKTGIFVSSPYHMRRIGMIAEKVFKGKEYRLTFVPTRYEEPVGPNWLLSGKELDIIISEYCKILWFSIYGTFKHKAPA